MFKLLVTSRLTIFSLIVNPRTDPDFPPRPMSCACCQTFRRPSMKATSQFWRYFTCQQRSTRSINTQTPVGPIHYLKRFRWHCASLVRTICLRSKRQHGLLWYSSGSVVGPMLFLMYTPDLMRIIELR